MGRAVATTTGGGTRAAGARVAAEGASASGAGSGSETANRRPVSWVRQCVTWHWVSSAICLVGLLLFAFTGITLNHAAEIESRPQVTTRTLSVPSAIVEALAKAPPVNGKGRVPGDVKAWAADALRIAIDGDIEADWSSDELYVPLPRPGGDAWLNIDLASGEATYELTDRGWVAYLNDLHKGRHTGVAWKAFLDVFAVACCVSCVTGLVLLQMYARGRQTTWPLVGFGVLIPVVLSLLFVH